MNNKDLRELGYIVMEDGLKIYKNIFGLNLFKNFLLI